MQVEQHSIDFIPHDERYGNPRSLFTLWFSVNMQVMAFVVGALGVAAGLSLFWALVAIVAGTAIGAIFMAGHSAQGPQLGIPQMIQSRAQFGVLGAAFPLCVMVLSYILFTAACAVVMRGPIQQALPISDNAAIVSFGLVTLIIAYVGYELIHRLAVVMSIISGLLFAVTAWLALSRQLPPGTWQPSASGIRLDTFMTGIMAAMSWSIGYAPFVADYSRYLPVDTKKGATFWYSYGGQFAGAIFVMSVGALVDSVVGHAVGNPAGTIAGLFTHGRSIVYLLLVAGVLLSNVMNVYSTYMSATTIFTGFHGASRISKRVKFLAMAIATTLATMIGIATQYHFDSYFSDIIIAQIYIVVPWTSINLCDFYFVRHGQYTTDAFFDTKGEYGRYNTGTLIVFLLSLIVQIPLMRLSFYVGPIARYFGTDVTMLVSIILPGAFYYIANMRNAATSRAFPASLARTTLSTD